MTTDSNIDLSALACQCPACSGQFGQDDAQSSSADISTEQLSDQINTGNPDTSAVIHTNGLKWGSSSFGSGTTVSYSFLSSVPSYYSSLVSNYGIDYPSGFIGFSTAQKIATREILSMYSDVANINFVETSGVGTLTFANHSMGSGVGAYAYYPNLQRMFPSDTAPLSGDVWVSNANRGTAEGSWGYLTLIHEIGHAIGLKHPGNYNAGGGGTDGPYLPSSKDNHQHTVMSYHDHPNHPSTSPVSPLLFDIAAVQYLYGVNNSTRTGNDTYTVNFYGEIKAIWDAGGNDTLSAAGTSRNATIRLDDGEFSSINGVNNIAIAYGAVIENATGGSGHDYLYGTSGSNRLDGGSGTDRLYGRSGDDTLIGGSSTDYLYGENGNDVLEGGADGDTLYGGSGDDTAVFSGSSSSYTIDDFGTYFRVTDLQGNRDGIDTLFDVEFARFQDGTVSLNGPELVLNSASVFENSVAGTLVGMITLDPPQSVESFTFALTNSAGGLFAINAISGAITTTQVLDHETIASANLGVRATGSNATVLNQPFTISIVDVNEAPEDIDDTPAFVIAEDAGIGDSIGTIIVEDPDAGDSHTFELTDDAGGLFSIDAATGEISVAGELDFETAASHQITIKGTDSGGLSNEWTRTVTVNDVNEAPETDGHNVVMAQGAVASAQLTATDDDGDAVTFSLDTDAANGTVTLSANGSYTYTPNESFIGSDSFTYAVSDGENITEETIDVTVIASGDAVVGQADSELLFAGNSGNTVDGQGGDDALQGGAGTDTLIGGDGNDILIGDSVNDSSLPDSVTPTSDETVVDTTYDTSIGQSNILALPDGGYVLITATDDPDSGISEDIAFQRYNAQGEEVGGEVIVNTSRDGIQTFQHAVVLSDGSFLIAWFDLKENDSFFRAQCFDGNGDPFGSELILDEQLATPGNFSDEDLLTGLVALSNGGFAVVSDDVGPDFFRTNDETPNTKLLIFDNAGQPVSETPIADNQDQSQSNSVATSLADGSFVIAWNEQLFPAAGNDGISFRRFSSVGEPLGEETVVLAPGTEQGFNPLIVALAGGGFAILWDDFSSGSESFAQIFSATGEATTGIVPIGNFYIADAEVEPTAEGGFVVYHSVHVNDDLQGDVYKLAADQFDADGNQVGGQTILNEAFSYDGYHATEVLKSGEHVVAFGSADIPGRGNGLVQLRVSTEIAEGSPSSFGNDTLIGGAGDDIIDGGGGDDIAVFEGRVLDYTITEDGTGLIVQDGVAGRDGTDTLTNVEKARFADGDFTLDGAAQLAVSETTVAEDVAAGGVVATVGAVFGDSAEAFTFELTDDAGGALSIDAVTGVVTTTTGLDHETAPTLDISVRATGDQGTVIDKDVTITVADVNEAPADTDDTAPLVIAEDAGIGDAVGTILVSDEDAGDTHTFELLDDAGGLFTIDAQTGVVSVAGTLNHEAADSLTITVQATDSGGLSNQWDHTISITDVNEAPDGGGAVAATGTEDSDVAFTRALFEASFADQDEGDGLHSVRVDTLPTGGTLLLAGAAVSAGTIIDAGDLDGLVFRPDADVNGTIGFDVSFGDGDLFSTAATTVRVALDAVNDAPVNIDLTPARVLEGSAAGTVAATVDAIDVDAGDTHTFSLDDNAGGLFEIDSVTGTITVTRDITLAETGAHEITVRAVDSGGLENTWTRTLTLDGDETILAGNDAEAIDGGSGIDTVDYSGSASGVTVDLEAGTGSGGDAAGDTFVRVENVTGSDFSDTLTGDDGSNVLAGGAGADTLNAGAGNDLYSFSVGDGADSVHDFTSHDETRTETQAYIAYRTAYRTVTVSSGEGNTTTSRIAYQQAYTAYRDIQITESFQDDGGVDALAFGAGIARSDILVRLDGADLLVGIKDADNPDTDIADLSDVIRITDWTDERSRVESLRFAAGNTVALTALLDSGALADGVTLDLATVQDDVVTAVGTDGADQITGFSGDDALSGGAGADAIEGGGGDDAVDGGEGDDVAVFAGAQAGYSVDYNEDGSLTVTDTDLTDGDDGSDTLTGIETLRFADGDVDVNDAPVDIDNTAALSVSESAAPGDAVGTIVVSDPDADDTHTFDLVDDAGGLFSIDAVTGVVTVAASLDFETASSHEITVRATDSGGLSNTWTRSITVGDANDAPEVTETLSASGPENTDIALGRSRFEAVFQDQDAGDALVSVRIDTVPSLGQLKLGGVDVQAGDVIPAGDLDTLVYHPVTDFGGDISFTFSVGDGEAFSASPAPFEISVFAVNDAPDGILVDNTSISESAAAGTIVGTATATDPDPFDIHTYSLTDDAGGLFSIDAATGAIAVAGDLDFETTSQHDITIRVEDAGGLSTEVTQTISVGNANDAPTAEGAVTLSGNEDGDVSIDLSAFTSVFADQDAGDTLQAVRIGSLPQNAQLLLNGAAVSVGDVIAAGDIAGLVIRPATDFSGDLSFDVALGDGTVFADTPTAVTVSIASVNDAPVDIDDTAALTVSEASGPGDSVGTIVVSDPDSGDSHTFELVDDAGGLFSIDAATGEVSVAGALDFETASSHQITIKGTDSGGLSNQWTRTVTVTDVNEAPVATGEISLTGIEDTDVQLSAASFNAVFSDPDAGNNLQSVRIDTQPGSGTLLLNGSVLSVGAVVAADDLANLVLRPDADFSGDLEFNVSVGDGTLFADSQTTVSVSVTAVNDAPTALDLVLADLDIDAAVGTTAGLVTVADPDANDTHQFSLVDDAGGAFAINQTTGEITVNAALTDEAAPYSITIQVVDSGGEQFTVTREIAIESDETIVATAAAESLDGKSGIDTIDFSASLAAVAVDLEAGTGSGGFASGDTYVNFENVIGSTFADALTGDAGSNVLSGGAGADVLDGGAGDDTADYSSSGEGVTVDLDTGTGAGGDAQGDTLTNVENVSGSAFDDRLTGDAGVNWLAGGAGADSLAGGGGNDLYHFGSGDGSDTVSDIGSQEGTETVSEAYTAYRTAYRTVTVSSGEGSTTTQRIAYQQAYTAYRDVEVGVIVAADGGQDAILFGENITRSDILVRLDGADLLVGIKDATQPGADIAGLSDTIRITDWTDEFSRVESVSFADGESVALSALYDNGVLVDGATVDLGVVDENSLVLLGTDADDTLKGQIGNDILTGLGGNDILQGAGGDDLVEGGVGSDIAVFNGAEAGYDVTYNDDGSLTVTDTDMSDGDDGVDTLTGIETLRFGDGDVDVNDAPVDIDTTPALSVSESAAVGAVVGTIIVSDPDAGDSHTFELVDDAGGLFSIDAATGAVSIAGSLDFETATSHEIVVRATDSGGLSNTWSRTITVSDANEAPVDIDDTAALTVSEAAGVGDSVGTIVVSDPDAGDSHTFELVDDAGGLFSIDAVTGDVSIAGSLDFETATSHEIVVRATDSGGISNTWTRTVTVTNANEAPVPTGGISLSGVEDTDVALTAASFAGVFSDPDAGDTLQSVRIDSLPAGGTLLLNGSALGLGAIVAASDLDGVVYRPVENANGAVSFTVSVGDGAVFAEDSTVVAIDLAAVNDAPTAIFLSNDAVDGDAVAGSEVGVVSVDDPDTGDSHVFELVDDAGGLFAIDADTGLITTTGALDDAASPYSITIRVEDAAGLSITQTRDIAVDSDETVVATAAAEAHDGGSGIDTIDYSASLAAVSVDLDAGTGSGGFATGDTLVNFENITGSAFADDLTGDAGSNMLSGGAGADALDGGASVDTADYSTSADGVIVDLDAGTGSGGDAHGDTLENIENVTGSAHDDRLWGDDASNHLTGGAGADTLGGGAGADVYHFGVGDGQDEVYDYASHDESRTETEAYTAYRTAYRTVTVSNGEGTTTQRVAYQQAYTAYRDVEYTDIVQDDAGLDRVVFGDGVTSSDILLQLDGADLLVGIKDAASPNQLIGDLQDVIRITDWTDTATRVETLAFQNGDEISLTELYDSGDITENTTFDLDSASDSSEAFGLTGLTESGLHDGTNRWISEPIDTDPASKAINDFAYDMPVTPVDEASGGSVFTAYYSYEIQVESAPEEGAASASDAALEPAVIPDVAPAAAGAEIDASVQQLVSAMSNWAVPDGLAGQEDTGSATSDQTLLDQLTVNSS